MSPNCAQAGRSIVFPSNQVSRREIRSLNQRKSTSEKGLEELLSSALLAGDKDLRQVLDEVDDLSKTLRLGEPDETARVALHPAVWRAVKQTLLERELRHLALTDDLTCLYNRRGFFAAATQQLKLARRNAQGLSLFLCDVRGLHEINNSCGRREGDLALIRVADTLQQTFRGSDVLARLDGDEFAVLALEACGQGHEAIRRRLEANLKKSNSDESRYTLSLSVGVAEFDPKHAASLGELMAQADQDMYEQKKRQVHA
jgi:diguanylate cyclase (GGDEF)-like protein